MNLNTAEELIEDIRAGKMVILMDDEDRENEGDLVMAASLIDAPDINFMATHARGLICLTLNQQRCKQLNLSSMVGDNQSSHHTNFTASIEAAEGVTTGISAADRARTVQAAVAPLAQPRDIVQPGHIFPLMAQPGGVLSRAGHTEAGCDLARLAGLEPAAVIVEIMNEDGSMARRPDLEKFAQKHQLKLGTIEDLIHYRIANESTVECVKTRSVQTAYGAFDCRTYLDTARDRIHHCLTRGEVGNGEPILTRVHLPSPTRDYFGLIEPGTENRPLWTLQQALQRVATEGRGVVVLLSSGESSSRVVEKQLASWYDDKEHRADERRATMEVGVGAQILRDLGVHKMRLMGGHVKYKGIAAFDLEVAEYIDPPSLSEA